MNLRKVKSYPIILSAMLLLSSCGGGGTQSGPTYSTGEKAFFYNADKVVNVTYDLSAEAYNINIFLDIEDKVNGVQIGRTQAEANQYGYKDGILTLAGSFLKENASGEKDITVSFEASRKLSIPALFCDKIIKTPQEFQDINNAPDGIYALGNDIDFANFGNFEPIGTFYSEEDTRNAYFHGILEGNGYAIKNLTAYYSDLPKTKGLPTSYESNYDVYSGSPKFSGSHVNGDNIGIFQVIGSSGLVRNLVFDNCHVRGRTIVGVVAGNIMGRAENLLIKANCSAEMCTHFYDNDCNTGAAFGIVAGSGNVTNCISLTQNVSVLNFYTDYGDDYPGKDGTDYGWDHPIGSPDNEVPWWNFAGVDRDYPKGSEKTGKALDSNGTQSNGVYGFAGKTWGQVSNSVCLKYQNPVFAGESNGTAQYTYRPINFSQTHLAELKPTSGGTDLGSLTNCTTLDMAGLKVASNFATFDATIWTIKDGELPSLVAPQVTIKTIA